jgi:hypothetical protein
MNFSERLQENEPVERVIDPPVEPIPDPAPISDPLPIPEPAPNPEPFPVPPEPTPSFPPEVVW